MKHYSLGEEDKQGLCPDGWRIPTKEDYILMNGNFLALSIFLKEKVSCFFNPDSLFYRWKDENKDLSDGYRLNSHLFSSEQWPYRESTNPFEFNLRFDGQLYMITSNEDPDDASQYLALTYIRDSPFSPSGFKKFEKSGDHYSIKNYVRCVQTVPEEETIQVWNDAFVEKWGMELIADYTLKKEI